MSPIENINTRTSDKKQQSPNDVENSKEKAAGDNSAAATSAKEVSEEARGDEG